MSDGERWLRAYRESPETFDAFTRAEDPEGRIGASLLDRARIRDAAVLEVGCGTGRYTEVLAPRAGFYTGVERSRPMLSLARERLRADPAPALIHTDARRLPLADERFDTVVAAWVVAHLRQRDRARVLAEATRVLRRGSGPGSGLWIVENHWEGPFQDLRGPDRADVERRRITGLIDEAGFSLVDTIHTELRFDSNDEAERVLGYLCGEKVRARLADRPRSTIGHHVVILHRVP